jgi:hypothetical protein
LSRDLPKGFFAIVLSFVVNGHHARGDRLT